MQCYSNYLRNVDGEVVCSCGEHREGNLLVETLARNVFIHSGSNLLIKKNVFNEVGGFSERISLNKDLDL